jgi:hypothetical protein
VFKEEIAAKSAVPMPKLTPKAPPSKQGGASGTPNYSLLSPVKVEATTSVAALKFEFSLVTSALKGGHKDGQTVQRGKLVRHCGMLVRPTLECQAPSLGQGKVVFEWRWSLNRG